MKLSIVIGTFNRLNLLHKCLRQIEKTVHVEHEAIVIDAGSTDGTVAYLKKMGKRIRVITQHKRIGQAKSLNKFFRRLNSKYVCWLSDDNIVRRGIMDIAVGILDKNSRIGMVGLKVKDITGPFAHEEYIGGIWPSGVLNVNQGMVRVDVLKKAGLFDENFPDYGMDADLTTKILLSGHIVVYTKKVAIEHARKYKEFPGAFTNVERSGKLLVALELYKRKYNKLCKPYQYKRFLYLKSMSALLRTLLNHLMGFRRFGFSLEKLTKYNKRDIINVFEAEFVSKLDLWYNRKKPYYLVQEIPLRIRSGIKYGKTINHHRS